MFAVEAIDKTVYVRVMQIRILRKYDRAGDDNVSENDLNLRNTAFGWKKS